MPCFPAALEYEDVRKIHFVAQAAGNVAAGLATEGAAIDYYFARGVPLVQHHGQEFVPMVFIEGKCAGDVGAGEIRAGPGVEPEDARAPCGGRGEGYFVRLPGRAAGMPEAGGERGKQGEEEDGCGLPGKDKGGFMNYEL